VIARRPDTIVGFGEICIHAETATFELRASEVANPRPGDQLTVGTETFVVEGEPERRDPDRLVWHVGREAHLRVPQQRKGKTYHWKASWSGNLPSIPEAPFRRKPWSRGRVLPSPR
jgi:hypothetical protein